MRQTISGVLAAFAWWFAALCLRWHADGRLLAPAGRLTVQSMRALRSTFLRHRLQLFGL